MESIKIAQSSMDAMPHVNGIHVYKHNWIGQMHFATKDIFFKYPVIVKISDVKVEFIHVGIDFNGKQYNFHNRKNVYFQSAFACEIPIGFYEFDKEECNEDIRVFYYSKENNNVNN